MGVGEGVTEVEGEEGSEVAGVEDVEVSETEAVVEVVGVCQARFDRTPGICLPALCCFRAFRWIRWRPWRSWGWTRRRTWSWGGEGGWMDRRM